MKQEIESQAISKQALGYLREVIDPEIGLNIVDLGLVYKVVVDVSNRRISVIMTLTTEFCPMGGAITESVEEILKDYYEGYEVEVNLIFEPSWHPGMITDAGRAFLEN